MAIYHLHVSTISRSSGRSAVAAAAYRACVQLTDARTGVTHDYRPRQRGGAIVESYIIVPEGAPEWALNRQTLWDCAEAVENRINSVTAREAEFAIPDELDELQASGLTRDIAIAASRRFNVAVDVARHSPNKKGDQRNRHVHYLMTTRELTGFGLGKKTRTLDDRRSGAMVEFREECARLTNEALALAGSTARVDHRSYKAQGIDRVPGIHLGAASGMERRDPNLRTPRGDRNRERAAANATKEAAVARVRQAERAVRQAGSEERMGMARIALGLPDPSEAIRPNRDGRPKDARPDRTAADTQRHRSRVATAAQGRAEVRTAAPAPGQRSAPSQQEDGFRIVATGAAKGAIDGTESAPPALAALWEAEQARMAQAMAAASKRRARAPSSPEMRSIIQRVLRVAEGNGEARFVYRDGDEDGPVAGIRRVLDAQHMPHRTEPIGTAGSLALIVAIDSLVELARQLVAAARHDVAEARLQLGRLARRLWKARIVNAGLVRSATVRAAKPQQESTARPRGQSTPTTSAGLSHGLKRPESMDVGVPSSVLSTPPTWSGPDRSAAADRGRASDVPAKRTAPSLLPAAPGSSHDARACALVPPAGTSPDTASSDQIIANEARRLTMKAAGAPCSTRDDQARQRPQIPTPREPPGRSGETGLVPPSTGGGIKPAATSQAEPVPGKAEQPPPQLPAAVAEQLGSAGQDAERWAAAWVRAVASKNMVARGAIVTVWEKTVHRDQAQLAAVRQSRRIISEWARADRARTLGWADSVDRLPPKMVAAVNQQIRQAGRGSEHGR